MDRLTIDDDDEEEGTSSSRGKGSRCAPSAVPRVKGNSRDDPGYREWNKKTVLE